MHRQNRPVYGWHALVSRELSTDNEKSRGAGVLPGVYVCCKCGQETDIVSMQETTTKRMFSTILAEHALFVASETT
jgi:hypothetical protein